MRVQAVAVVALMLVAGCSESVGGRPQAGSSTIAPTPCCTSRAPSSSTKAAPPQGAPAAGAPISDVIGWIEAGEPADPGAYHSATRQGSVTQLQNGDVAFITPSGKTSCMTDSMFSTGDLACLVQFTNPPPRPPDAYGEWIGNWVEFDGPTLSVGSVHGDPGRFIYGDGPQLPYGKSLKFGDYQCRADQAGMFCVNYAHQSGARINDAGVEPFGCLQKVPPPQDIGVKFSCSP
jgi:hypothetical protein